MPLIESRDDSHEEIKPGCCERLARWMQNTSYQLMAFTFWDNIMSGFKPGRARAFELMDVKSTDQILLVGEGSGLDFECLPHNLNPSNVKAFDFSTEMVKQSKKKAPTFGIPEENCFWGDAQQMPFQDEKFHKIFFPLSLASIPNPKKALQEAERVLAPGGKIVIFEKLLDDDTSVSTSRYYLNYFTKSTFADINRNLSNMLGDNSPLKITHYETLQDRLEDSFTKTIGAYYRLAVLVRKTDCPEEPGIRAKLRAM